LLTILLAVVMVIAFAYLMTDYARQQKRQATFTDEIENAQRSLAILTAPPAGLEKQLADITATNSQALRNLADTSLNSTSIIDSLLVLTDGFNLKVAPLTTDAWINKKVGDSAYKVLPLEFQLEGPLKGLIGFVKTIDDSQKYPNLLVTGMKIQNDPEAVKTMNKNSDLVTANLSVSIVIRSPSSP
jgi:preprotein translocase subunit YajC